MVIGGIFQVSGEFQFQDVNLIAWCCEFLDAADNQGWFLPREFHTFGGALQRVTDELQQKRHIVLLTRIADVLHERLLMLERRLGGIGMIVGEEFNRVGTGTLRLGDSPIFNRIREPFVLANAFADITRLFVS